MKFNDHAYMVAKKADEAMSRLTRIMQNTGGAKSYRRKFLALVTQSVMMYGVSVWVRQMSHKRWEILDKTNRKMGLIVITSIEQ